MTLMMMTKTMFSYLEENEFTLDLSSKFVIILKDNLLAEAAKSPEIYSDFTRQSRDSLSEVEGQKVKPGETELFSKHFGCFQCTYSRSAVDYNRWTTR